MAAVVAAPSAHEDPRAGADSEHFPVKNTFIHFGGKARSRSLRVCVTDPEDPVLMAREQKMPVVYDTIASEAASDLGAGDDADDARTVTTEATSAEIEELAIHTPELTPRHAESPLGSLSNLSNSSICPNTPSPLRGNQGTPPGHWHAGGGLPWSLLVPACQPSPPGTSLPATPCPPLEPEGAFRFSFTLRLAEAGGLGIEWADRTTPGSAVCVRDVVADGAIEAWNRQCADANPLCSRAVAPEDQLVEVNKQTDAAAMLAECDTKLLLKLTFLRPKATAAAAAAAAVAAVSASAAKAAAPSKSDPQWPGPGAALPKGTKVCLRIHSALQGGDLHACLQPVKA